MKQLPPNGELHSFAAPDPLVVPLAELRAVLDVWVRAQDLRTAAQKWRPGSPIGGIQMLAAQSGVRVDTIENIMRRDRTRHVGLGIADLLLVAVGEVDALYDGRVRVLANPRWSRAGWEREMHERGCESVEGLL